MSPHIEPVDFIDVRACIADLGLEQPEGIAILPSNLESAKSDSELIYAASAESVVKVLRGKALQVKALSAHPLTTRKDQDHTLILPMLFFGAAYLSQDQNTITVALSIIANYATQMMQGVTGGKVRMSVAIEKTKSKTVKRFDYEGPPSGLSDIAKQLERFYGQE